VLGTATFLSGKPWAHLVRIQALEAKITLSTEKDLKTVGVEVSIKLLSSIAISEE